MTLFRINAGKYRHVVTFQRLRNTPNDYGEISKAIDANWEDAFKARVQILPINGKEVIARQGEKGEIKPSNLYEISKWCKFNDAN